MMRDRLSTMGNLSQPISVRLLIKDKIELDQLSDETGITPSKLVRLAVKIGLPDLVNQLGRRQPERRKEEIF